MIDDLKMFSFYNAGRDCTQPCRYYVADRIYDNFVADMGAAVASVKTGMPDADGTEMGHHHPRSISTRSALCSITVQADKRLEVVTGGKSMTGSGFFIEPTLIANAEQGDQVVEEEIFWPCCDRHPFSDVDPAIA